MEKLALEEALGGVESVEHNEKELLLLPVRDATTLAVKESDSLLLTEPVLLAWPLAETTGVSERDKVEHGLALCVTEALEESVPETEKLTLGEATAVVLMTDEGEKPREGVELPQLETLVLRDDDLQLLADALAPKDGDCIDEVDGVEMCDVVGVAHVVVLSEALDDTEGEAVGDTDAEDDHVLRDMVAFALGVELTVTELDTDAVTLEQRVEVALESTLADVDSLVVAVVDPLAEMLLLADGDNELDTVTLGLIEAFELADREAVSVKVELALAHALLLRDTDAV